MGLYDYKDELVSASEFCDCAEDGYCERYQRDMGGRMRELCQGVNVDLGTAAAFREEWAREAGTARPWNGEPRRVILRTNQAPGDAVAMTAAIYSLHQSHPGRYRTAIECPWPEIFQDNPDVAWAGATDTSELHHEWAPLDMHYPAIHRSNERGIHFMQGWCEFLGSALGVSVPLMTNRPHLYFNHPAPEVGKYWVVCSGGKQDFTNKAWGQHNYQTVINACLLNNMHFIQVGEKAEDHPLLEGTISAVGKTTLRQLFELVRCSCGVLCGVSLMMHVAAALGKPAVVIAGGREPVPWNSYPLQQYLHTVGALRCSDAKGKVGGACWRSRVVPLGDGSSLDVNTCERPVNGTPTRTTAKCVVPECMTMIKPLEVVEKILRYNR